MKDIDEIRSVLILTNKRIDTLFELVDIMARALESADPQIFAAQLEEVRKRDELN